MDDFDEGVLPNRVVPAVCVPPVAAVEALLEKLNAETEGGATGSEILLCIFAAADAEAN